MADAVSAKFERRTANRSSIQALRQSFDLEAPRVIWDTIARRSGQANNCSIGDPPSTIFKGRPMGLMFSLSGRMCSDLQIVLNRSGTDTGSFVMVVPSLDVSPITCPPRIPPPAMRALKLRGQ